MTKKLNCEECTNLVTVTLVAFAPELALGDIPSLATKLMIEAFKKYGIDIEQIRLIRIMKQGGPLTMIAKRLCKEVGCCK